MLNEMLKHGNNVMDFAKEILQVIVNILTIVMYIHSVKEDKKSKSTKANKKKFRRNKKVVSSRRRNY